jgi:hypothetical protein
VAGWGINEGDGGSALTDANSQGHNPKNSARIRKF